MAYDVLRIDISFTPALAVTEVPLFHNQLKFRIEGVKLSTIRDEEEWRQHNVIGEKNEQINTQR